MVCLIAIVNTRVGGKAAVDGASVASPLGGSSRVWLGMGEVEVKVLGSV